MELLRFGAEQYGTFRRRYPFAAPAGLWVVAAALSFVDGGLVTFTASASIAGLAAAFLLGNLRDATLIRIYLRQRQTEDLGGGRAVHVQPLAEGAPQVRVAGEVGHDPQLDLRVVGRHDP